MTPLRMAFIAADRHVQVLAVFFQLATPFPEVQRRAYAAALILLIMVFVASLSARLLSRRFSKHIIR